jgi:Bacterial SCP ortholog
MPCPTRVPRPRTGVFCPPIRPYRPVVAASRVNSAAVSATLSALDASQEPQPGALRDAVRALLTVLRERAPGRTVEVRIPPFGAIQCVEGPRHTRGTPPNVVETDPTTFVLLATGRLTWLEAVQGGRLHASGVRADLSPYLPCWPAEVDGATDAHGATDVDGAADINGGAGPPA